MDKLNGNPILILGDCFNAMDMLLANDIKADAIIIDPPYGVLNKRCTWDKAFDLEKMLSYCYKMRRNENTPIIIFSQEPFTSELIVKDREKFGGRFKYKWYWQKTQATGHLNANKQPLRCIEEILVFYEKQCLYNPQKTYGHSPVHSYTKYLDTVNKSVVYGETNKEISGGGNTDRFPRNLITFKSDKQTNYLHPTQKPLDLLSYLIATYTNPFDTVLDFCMGSGTTGEAALKNCRKFIGVENNEEYYKIAKERLMK